MCHAALTCAVLYCIVDQVVLGIRLLAELIWILSSSCLNVWLPQSWPQSKLARRSTSSSSRSDSVPKRTKQEGPIRTEAKRTDNGRTETRRTGAAPRSKTLHETLRETAHEMPCEACHETPQETINETPYERNTSRNAPTNHPNETPRETPHETPRSTSYESPHEIQ